MSAVASVSLCAGAGCSGRGLIRFGGYCEECFKRGPDTPPELVRLARRARLYYGLTAEAAKHLGVGRDYVSSVINLHRVNPSGRLGHRRIFVTVAGLVRDCEAACLALYQSFHLMGGRFMRSEIPSVTYDATLNAAVLACFRGGQTTFHTWADDTTELARLLLEFAEAGRAGPGRVPIEQCSHLSECPAGCAGHVLIMWRGGRPVLMFDREAALSCMAALEEVLADSDLFSSLCANALPLHSLNVCKPCA